MCLWVEVVFLLNMFIDHQSFLQLIHSIQIMQRKYLYKLQTFKQCNKSPYLHVQVVSVYLIWRSPGLNQSSSSSYLTDWMLLWVLLCNDLLLFWAWESDFMNGIKRRRFWINASVTVTIRLNVAISVTRWGNKKLPNFGRKLPKK